MKSVELIYDAACPNVEEARTRLRRALTAVGLPTKWQEWERGDPNMPEHAKGVGSPTILVDRRDVTGDPALGDCCRIYRDPQGKLTVAPDERAIIAALQVSVTQAGRASWWSAATWRSAMLVAPALVTAALPKLTCPACWPAYAGLLAALGVGFVNYTPYLFPLTALFLVLAVLPVARRAGGGGQAVLFLGGALVAALVILLGKFLVGSDTLMYAGIAGLMITTLWSSVKARKAVVCTRKAESQ